MEVVLERYLLYAHPYKIYFDRSAQINVMIRRLKETFLTLSFYQELWHILRAKIENLARWRDSSGCFVVDFPVLYFLDVI